MKLGVPGNNGGDRRRLCFFYIERREGGQKACLGRCALEEYKSGGGRVRAGRPHAREFVSLAQRLDGNASGKPRGMSAGLAEDLVQGILRDLGCHVYLRCWRSAKDLTPM